MPSATPVIDIDLGAFNADPYPLLASMRKNTPVCFVPQLQATLLTRHEDIVECEKNIEVFSSEQPGGLMNVLMGENMMRKDGAQHVTERKQSMPALSPRIVKQIWRQQFELHTDQVIESLKTKTKCDLVTDYAMPVSAHALRCITGLMNMTPQQLDKCSQDMIDGISNYAGDQSIEDRCNRSTDFIDQCIDEMLVPGSGLAAESLLQVLVAAEQPMASVRANVKLAISGGQNEPRDAIAGCVWTLLKHPEQLKSVLQGIVSWRQVFEEFARWISPIGMSPRRIAKSYQRGDYVFEPEGRAFLMFGSANRDEAVFKNADQFDIHRDTTAAVSFGAGPHFCAGAAASRALIAEVALPKLFQAYPDLAIDGEVNFNGWAFRGPISMPVSLGHFC